MKMSNLCNLASTTNNYHRSYIMFVERFEELLGIRGDAYLKVARIINFGFGVHDVLDKVFGIV